MECFAHVGAPSVGVCKSCGKGVCRTCAISVDKGLACSEICRRFAESLSMVQGISIRNAGLQSAQRLILPLFPVLFLAVGVYLLANGQRDVFTWMYFAAGSIMGIAMLLARRRRGVPPAGHHS